MTSQQIDDLDKYASSSAYSDLEKTVLAFTEQLTRSARVEPSVMEKLKKSLSPEHLVRLAAAVGQANWTNRFNNAFGIELP